MVYDRPDASTGSTEILRETGFGGLSSPPLPLSELFRGAEMEPQQTRQGLCWSGKAGGGHVIVPAKLQQDKHVS